MHPQSNATHFFQGMKNRAGLSGALLQMRCQASGVDAFVASLQHCTHPERLAMQCNELQCNAMSCNAMQCNALLFSLKG
jgi:hypothetical protein